MDVVIDVKSRWLEVQPSSFEIIYNRNTISFNASVFN